MWARAPRGIPTAALLCAALVCALLASSTFAQDHSTVVRVLSQSGDFRARVRAALALGSSGDERVAPHLVEALSDESPAVRAAAATALGRLASPTALAPLRRALSDRTRVVRTEAERAIARIEASAPRHRPSPQRPLTRTQGGGVLPSISVVPRARDINWGLVRYVVIVGDLDNRSRFRHDDLGTLLKREVTRSLIVLRGVAAIQEDQVTAAAQREMQRRRVPKLRLEGSVNRVERRAQRSELSVRCEVSLMLLDEPERRIRSVLNGAATGSAARRGPRQAQERRLAEQALSGAVRSAMSGASQAIASAGR